MSTEVQSIIFDKSMYSVTEAKKWLRENGYIAPKVDKTDRYLRFRQKQPSYFDESSFRTIPFGKNTGIKAIIGVPMKHNPFYPESDTPSRDGHRIGAYAMLFTKAKNKWKSTGDPLELEKAKEYWDQYIAARDRYKTVEDRLGASILLHEKGSFDRAIQNPKQRNNPMKTHKNLSIDDIDEYVLNSLHAKYRQIGGSADFADDAFLLEGAKGKSGAIVLLDDGYGNWEIYRVDKWGGDEESGHNLTLIESIGDSNDLFNWLNKQRNNPMKTHKNPVIDGKVLVANMNGLRKLYTGREYHTALNRITETLEPMSLEFGIPVTVTEQTGTKNGSKYKVAFISSYMGDIAFIEINNKRKHLHYLSCKPHLMSSKGRIDLDSLGVVSDEQLAKSQYKIEEYRSNPHCHCYGAKKNPHCAVHGRKNPYGTAMVQGSMGGLAYRYNPTKKIMDFESFMDHLEDGNVFVGRYVVFVQNGVPMRLEIGSSTPKEVSPEVAFYADLAGQAELVGTSDIDSFSDDYRLLIRQASDAASGGIVAGGGVPVVEIEEIIAPSPVSVMIDPAVEKLAELESLFQNAQYIKTAQELDRTSSNLKYLLGEVLKVGKREEKKVISRLQILADNTRAKKPETLIEKILKRYIKFAEKSMGAKIDIVDDETGKKTTPKKEAEKIVEEIQADPDYRPQFDMQKHLARGGIIQTPKVMKAPFDIIEEEIVVPTPAPTPATDDLKALLAAMAKQQADFIGKLKKNPRDSHYAYRMSTLDHDHRMNHTALNNVFIKKNPSDAFRFPQVEVLGVNIDNDIYTWLSSSLPNWDSVIPLLTGEYAQYKETVETLANQAKQFMVDMQTEIVPAVESRVKKALATGKTLKDILGEEKKNPYRRNTKRQRRYY